MKYSKYGFYALLWTALVVVSGCSEDSKTTEPKNPDVCDTAQSPCISGYSCVDKVCLKNAELGEACGEGIHCIDGKCVDGLCKKEDDQGDGDDNPNSGLIGSQCQSDKQCKEGTCLNRVCTETVGVGESCSSALPCEADLVCDEATSKCIKTAGVGEACSESVVCKLGECLDGVCTIVSEDDKLKMTDTDNDTIPDYWDRCDADTDGDGTPDCEDLDADGDTIPDSVEAGAGRKSYEEPTDTDSDGVYDFLSKDSDGNGIPDSVEGSCKVKTDEGGEALVDDEGNVVVDDACKPLTIDGAIVRTVDGIPLSDVDGDTIPDFQSLDNDGDGYMDEQEIRGVVYYKDGNVVPGRMCGEVVCEPGTPENPWDSDGDTIPDYNDSDSDGDTIPDWSEYNVDTDGDGNLDMYDLDSDGDTIPDADEKDLVYVGEGGRTTRCVLSPDCDGDGLLDGEEIVCDPELFPGVATKTMLSPDSDADGYSDAAEYAAALYAIEYNKSDACRVEGDCFRVMSQTEIGVYDNIERPEQLICDGVIGVKDVFDFYFELPKDGPEKTDVLEFSPSVSKLDVVINLDVTGSMQAEIDNIKEKLANVIIPETRKRVTDSSFGVSAFADFPVYLKKDKGSVSPDAVRYGYPTSRGVFQADKPWLMLANVTTLQTELLAAVQKYELTDGADNPEAGYESLWQIVGADTVTKETQAKYATMKLDEGLCVEPVTGWESLPVVNKVADRWGGAQFRKGSLPVVVHVTDAPSHNSTLAGDFGLKSYNYNEKYIANSHSDVDVHDLYAEKGARLITVYRRSATNAQQNKDGEGIVAGAQHPVLLNSSTQTDAVVPVCAFKTSATDWKCGENKCCTVTTNANSVDPNEEGKCALSYGIVDGKKLSDTLVDGIDALVKYGTNEVATRVVGEPIEGSEKTTACFIKRVEAKQYVAPAQEPEKSCNPVATMKKFKANPEDPEPAYFNGFENFAAGTSSTDRKGAQLHFNVIAQNDGCVEPKKTAQTFSAQVELYNPTTNLSLGKREVYIIVPGEVHENIVN